MRLQKIFNHKKHLQVLVYQGGGAPYALRINLSQIIRFISLFVGVLLSFLMGTLLFFRELEISRHLEDRVLDLELARKAPESVTPSIAAQPPKKEIAAPRASEQPQHKAQKQVASLPSSTAVNARISALSLDCKDKECLVRVNMVPSGSGSAQGRLVLVLESQLSRIGTTTHTDEARKRYVLYPGFDEVSDIDPKKIAELKGKSFRFSNALQSTVTFYLGGRLSPVAVQAYVFDLNGSLVTKRTKTLSEKIEKP